MDRRAFVEIAAIGVLGGSLPAGAQSPAAPRRIGLLSGFSRTAVDAFLAELRPELEKLGWVDARNIAILEPRTSDGVNERLPAAAAEVIAQRPDVVLVQTLPATRALMAATRVVPIVMYS